MGSSLPRHGARIRTKTQAEQNKKTERKTMGKLQVSIKKIIEQKSI